MHPETVSDYTREGMPVLARGGHGVKSTYDLVSCTTWWRNNKTELSKPAAALARNQEAAAEFNELKVAEKKGALVPLDEMIRDGQAYTKAIAAAVRGFPRQLVLDGIVTRDQEHAIAAKCRELMSTISSWQTLEDAIRAAAQEPDA